MEKYGISTPVLITIAVIFPPLILGILSTIATNVEVYKGLCDESKTILSNNDSSNEIINFHITIQ